jgi:hypothetical protein
VEFFSDNLAAIILVLAGLCLLGIVMLQSLQVSRLRVRIDQLTGGVDGGDLEAVLGHHLETVHQVGRDLDELTARMAVVESASRHHFARAGLVRFNPFPDTGGNQSFALALLDESEDGVVVSSLHSRTGTRIYAKSVSAGKADTSLSAEEQDAIDEARAKRPMRPAAPPRSAAAGRSVQPAAQTAAVAALPTAPSTAPAETQKPAPKPAPERAPEPVVRAAAPAPVTPPAPAVPAAPAPGRKPAPTPIAKSAPASTTNQDEEATNRPTSERTKGQEKPKDLATLESDTAADSEKMDRKPGQAPAGGPGRR